MFCTFTECLRDRLPHPLRDGSETRRRRRNGKIACSIYLLRFKQFGGSGPMLPTWCVQPLNELVWCIISPHSPFQHIANFKETTAFSIRNWLTIFPTIDGLTSNANQASNAFLRKARCGFDPANGVEMWWTCVRCCILLFSGRLFASELLT